jgi:hypothetical protein
MSGPLVTPVVIPANQSAGAYFLIVRVDNAGPPGAVIEANEANNGLAVPLSVVQPDLTVQSVTATPPAIAPGGNVSVTHVVKNLAVLAGAAPVSTTTRLYLSNNATLEDPGDVVLGDVAIGPLAGGAMATLTKSLQVPGGTTPGLYWIIARRTRRIPSRGRLAGPGQQPQTRPDRRRTGRRSRRRPRRPARRPDERRATYTLKNRGGRPRTP